MKWDQSGWLERKNRFPFLPSRSNMIILDLTHRTCCCVAFVLIWTEGCRASRRVALFSQSHCFICKSIITLKCWWDCQRTVFWVIKILDDDTILCSMSYRRNVERLKEITGRVRPLSHPLITRSCIGSPSSCDSLILWCWMSQDRECNDAHLLNECHFG